MCLHFTCFCQTYRFLVLVQSSRNSIVYTPGLIPPLTWCCPCLAVPDEAVFTPSSSWKTASHQPFRSEPGSAHPSITAHFLSFAAILLAMAARTWSLAQVLVSKFS